MKNVAVATLLVFFFFSANNQPCQASSYTKYNAAVIEYASHYDSKETPFNNVKMNIERIAAIIKETKNVQIIVFPEAAVTSLETMHNIFEHLKPFGLYLPKDGFNPCTTKNSTYKNLETISCAAKENNVYVVINLLEREDAPETKFYNTDVVFNNMGEIVARYRKINLNKHEANVSPGKTAVSFTTNFNVTFGLITGLDLLYKEPTLELIQKHKVTDLIMTSALNSTLPFLQTVSIQAGLSTAYNVNLLAANLYDASTNASGSGLYSADGISHVYVSNMNKNQTIMDSISMPKKRENGCDRGIEKKQYMHGTKNIKHYKFDTQILSMAKNNDVDFSKKESTYEVCHENFCCNFEITLTKNSLNSKAIYKVMALTRSLDESNKMQEFACSLMPCQTINPDTCGIGLLNLGENEPKPEFESIKVTTEVQEGNVYIPITLNDDFVPLDNYQYCLNDKKITIKTNTPTYKVNTFGILGRGIFSDSSNAAYYTYNTCLVLTLVSSLLMVLK